MGFGKRFLTAGVAIPLALWAIFYDAQLCLGLVLGLQAICIQELLGLLGRTSSARAIASVGVKALSPLLLHAIAAAISLTSAFGGRDRAGLAMSVGVAALVVRRLALMCDHWGALCLVGKDGGKAIESGVLLLALELSATLWVVAGWSSLAAVRFRGPTGAMDVVALLAIVFNSDNGGLFAGTIAKMARNRQPRQSTAAPSTTIPGLLSVASPNKTWVGIAGAMFLGTATALGFGVTLRFLSGLVPASAAALPEEAFSLASMTPAWLGVAGAGICAVGIVGDLWESLLKRLAVVKDSGTVFPGHGGCLDRLDGVLAAAPLYLALVRMRDVVVVPSP